LPEEQEVSDYSNLDLSCIASPDNQSIDSGYGNSIMESPKLSFCLSPTIEFESVKVTEVGSPVFEKISEIASVPTFCATKAVDTSDKERFLEIKSTINTYGYYLKWTQIFSFLIVEERDLPILEMITKIDTPDIEYFSATKCEKDVACEGEVLIIGQCPVIFVTGRPLVMGRLAKPAEMAYRKDDCIHHSSDGGVITATAGILVQQHWTRSYIVK
jgi:hypothetical protein